MNPEGTLSDFLQEISLYADIDSLEETAIGRHPHDAAQRQGSGVPGGVHHRHGGGALPALPLAGRAAARGGAAPLLRGHHPGPGQSVPVARAAPAPSTGAPATRCPAASWARSPPVQAVPGGRPGPTPGPRTAGARQIRASAGERAGQVHGGAGQAAAASARRCLPGAFAPGDKVLHAKFGEGSGARGGAGRDRPRVLPRHWANRRGSYSSTRPCAASSGSRDARPSPAPLRHVPSIRSSSRLFSVAACSSGGAVCPQQWMLHSKKYAITVA